ncbi:hypothetical protein J1N35_005887 [Gossypium stocksii]|uniref:Serine aminopeptidase S33 domain-containing protein n=1 Tax=Gossypium stocksii TaxID=47602 RepID=A0A9D3WEQ6_9ROSI|nr:hypothetical protein J1N35_005887 [Gossypium stocksii]
MDNETGVLEALLGSLPKDAELTQALVGPKMAAASSMHQKNQAGMVGVSAKTSQLECSRFDGSDFRGWWTKLEQYCEAEGTPESSKIRLLTLNLEGRILEWHHLYLPRNEGLQMLSWSAYLKSMQDRFGFELFENPMEELVNLKQQGRISLHLQTVLLSFLGRAPPLTYRRHLSFVFDGGTIALDWLTYKDVAGVTSGMLDSSATSKDDKTPIVIVIPGLSSNSVAAYVKHFAFNLASQCWNVVVSNHRGLGGVSLMSDCCYNAGWYDNLRKISDHIRCEYPRAPLYVVGTSIAANILLKYLGEDGVNTPLVGATAICSPWDLLTCDRFINRRPMQKLYDRALTVGLQDSAHLHQSILSRIANWEGIEKSSSLRDFDNHATRVLGKFETMDTYYKRSSSTDYVENVSIPLLCVSALDDPVCTNEAIPWDECRLNENIILATSPHGGHLAFYEGITALRIWRVMEDRTVTTMSNEQTDAFVEDISNEHTTHSKRDEGIISDRGIAMWGSMKALVRGFEYMMAVLLFVPIAIVARLPFVSEFQTRLLFNQAITAVSVEWVDSFPEYAT